MVVAGEAAEAAAVVAVDEDGVDREAPKRGVYQRGARVPTTRDVDGPRVLQDITVILQCNGIWRLGMSWPTKAHESLRARDEKASLCVIMFDMETELDPYAASVPHSTDLIKITRPCPARSLPPAASPIRQSCHLNQPSRLSIQGRIAERAA